MRILVGCEESQVVTIELRKLGHGETKATCLWFNNLPELKPTNIVEGREQRIWKLPPTEDRAKERSKTFPGIAKAMAEQWTKIYFYERIKTNNTRKRTSPKEETKTRIQIYRFYTRN